jgi:hypothetical protein
MLLTVAGDRIVNLLTARERHAQVKALVREDAREEIEMLYPTAKLAKTPRWPTTAENRPEKAASSMVITIVGHAKLSKMLLFNLEWEVREYLPFRDTTQCSQCQRFGHRICNPLPSAIFQLINFNSFKKKSTTS